MRASLILCITMIGCIPKPVPPTPPQVVEVRSIVIPIKALEITPDEPEFVPVRTWITGDELKALEDAREEEAVRAGQRCRRGDPLCSDIGVDP